MNGAGRTPRLAVVRVPGGDGSGASPARTCVEPMLPSPAEPEASGAFPRASAYDAETLPTVPRGRAARPEAPVAVAAPW